MASSRTLRLFPLALALALAAMAGLAHAQPSPAGEAALEIHRLRLEAEQHERRGEHVACAQKYLMLVEKDPNAKETDELLYNAGICLEEGKLIGRAIETYEELERRFPSSKLAARALVRRADASASRAHYEDAAMAYERYARRYAGEKDAPHALLSALVYRRALGHYKEAISNIENFVKLYQKKRKHESAEALFSLAGLYEDQGDEAMAIKAYQRYIKELGKSGGLDRMLVANARIGELLWRQSCVGGRSDGACLRPIRRRAPGGQHPARCGPESIVRVQVIGRRTRPAQEGRRYFKAALALASRGAVDNAPDEARQAAARYGLAATHFYSLDSDFERYHELTFPRGLNFADKPPGVTEQSKERFQRWMEEKKTLAEDLKASYTKIVDAESGSTVWAIAAAARLGQLPQEFSVALLSAEIPKELRKAPYADQAVNDYCTALTASATPLEDVAIENYAACLQQAQRHESFGPWSRLCESELQLLRPEDFPRAAELHGASTAVGDILSTEALARH